MGLYLREMVRQGGSRPKEPGKNPESREHWPLLSTRIEPSPSNTGDKSAWSQRAGSHPLSHGPPPPFENGTRAEDLTTTTTTTKPPVYPPQRTGLRGHEALISFLFSRGTFPTFETTPCILFCVPAAGPASAVGGTLGGTSKGRTCTRLVTLSGERREMERFPPNL